MKKKTLKMAASAMVLAFSLSTIPAPALAVSSNIVAETKNVNTLTISQIQDLAVIYNDTAQKLQLSMKQLDLNEQMLRNQRRTIENSINSMGGSSGSESGIVAMKQTLDSLEAAVKNNPTDTALQAQYAAMKIQYESALATQSSMAASMQSSLDSALDGIDQLNNSLDSISNNKDDLSKGIKDLETQMRYSAGSLALSIVQLDKGIELIEDQIALLEKSVQIAELQQKLGMNIVTDVESQQTSLKDAQKNLEDQKETLWKTSES